MTMHSAVTLGAALAAAALIPAAVRGEPQWMGRYRGTDGSWNHDGRTLIPTPSGTGGDWGSSGSYSNPTPYTPPYTPPEQQSYSDPPPEPKPEKPWKKWRRNGKLRKQKQQEPEPAQPAPKPERPWKRWRRNGKLRKQKQEYQQAQGQVQTSFHSQEPSGDNSKGAEMNGSGPGTPVSGEVEGHATWFSAMGHSGPISACGVPTEMYVDDNGKELPFVALNTISEFKDGANCGRWIEATIGDMCQGGGNVGTDFCSGGTYGYEQGVTGEVMHLYVSDMCPDLNPWCQNDKYHLDVSSSYLESMGWGAGMWNNPKVAWKYMDGPPAGYAMNTIKFILKDGSKYAPNEHGFYASLVVVGVTNGISGCDQKVGDSWEPAIKMNELGQQWQLNFPDDVGSANPRLAFDIKCYDIDGKPYGTYNVPFPCDGICGEYTEAKATKID